jgi:biotin carboxyl carrier protein
VIVELEIGGRVRRVELNRAGHAWRATVDGKVHDVDAASIERWSSMLVKGTGGPAAATGDGPAKAGPAGPSAWPAASYETTIDDRGGGELVVSVNGAAIPVVVRDPRATFRGGQHLARSAGTVVAPMPGRVLRVLVKPGDVVSARQGLVVVEAMKMENELRAPSDARVVEVRATEGMLVEAKTVLLVLE